jgi:hypothetical protein
VTSFSMASIIAIVLRVMIFWMRLLKRPCGASGKRSHGRCGSLDQLVIADHRSIRIGLVVGGTILLYMYGMIIKIGMIIHMYSERG